METSCGCLPWTRAAALEQWRVAEGVSAKDYVLTGCDEVHGILPDATVWVSGRAAWTVAPSISQQLFKNGPSWDFRINRNFGPVTAAQHEGGIYAVGGLVFPLELVQSFGRF